jgi:hypothetical protein
MVRGALKEKDMEPTVSGFEFYIESFFELSTCRSAGMGEGPIPFTAIIQFATLYEVDDIEDFNYVIRKMDNAYLKFKDKKDGSKASQGNSSKGGLKRK